jgi:cell division protein FtsN
MPPRRSATLAKRHAQQKRARNSRSKPGRTPVWLWLIGGIAVGAVLAVALFFQDTPRGGDDTNTADKKTEKKTKAKPSYTEKDYQLEDLHDEPSRDQGQTTAVAVPPPKPTTPQATARPPAKPATPRPPRVTPPKPRPKPVTKTTKAGKGPRYWLQAGAFRSESQADNLKARLTLSGLPVRVVRAQVKGKTWYRVRIGPYRDNARLNRAKAKLRRQKIQAGVIKERG